MNESITVALWPPSEGAGLSLRAQGLRSVGSQYMLIDSIIIILFHLFDCLSPNRPEVVNLLSERFFLWFCPCVVYFYLNLISFDPPFHLQTTHIS